jgi:DNA-binding transcriptional MerR regulator
MNNDKRLSNMLTTDGTDMDKTPLRHKVLYLDATDAAEEVGITRRQLKYWQDNELLEPELGTGAGRYTAEDIERLRVIKCLVVDNHFPIEFVRKLVGGELFAADRAGADAEPARELLINRFLDLDTGRLLKREQLAARLWGEFGAMATEAEVEERLYALALLLFRLIRARSHNPRYYQLRSEDVLATIRDLSDAGRIEAVYEHPGQVPDAVFDPPLPDDPQDEASRNERIAHLLRDHNRRLKPFRAAASELRRQEMRKPEGERQMPESSRYFDDLLVELVLGL